jgi:hypothetical protein
MRRIALAWIFFIGACSSAPGDKHEDSADLSSAAQQDGAIQADGATGQPDGAVLQPDAGTVQDAALSNVDLTPTTVADDLAHATDNHLPTGCGPCDTPPDACHALTGSCQGSLCVYAFVEGAGCDDGDACTVADTCTGGVCAGTPKTCDSPPSGVCLSGTQAKTYDHTGSCNGGLCVYPSHNVTCGAGGCSNNACQSDPCAGITCDTPPSGCYLATGSCSAGGCSYGFNDGAACNDNNLCTSSDQCNSGACKGVPKSCASPPANSCANGTTLQVYTAAGSCAPATGDCSYSYGFVSCPTGCSGGICNPSGWTLATSNTSSDLYSVWGSAANAVWAVGRAGTMVFFNGTQWQVRTIPPQAVNQDLWAIHGTSASNVFLAAGTALLNFDGGKWNKVGDLPTINTSGYLNGIFASGDASNNVYVTMTEYAAGTPTPALYVINSAGTRTRLGGNADQTSSECFSYAGGVWEFSSTNVIFSGCHARQWNGSAVGNFGSAALIGVQKLWAASPTSMFGIAAYDGYTEGTNVAIWDGSTWSSTPSGITGSLTAMWGTSDHRVFFSGIDKSKSAIVYFDGLGFTDETLPATATQELNGIWAAPTGEVFAVGNAGTILQGP